MAIATLSIDLVAKLANLERDMGKAAHIAEKNAKRMDAAFSKVGSALAAIGVTAVAGSLAALVGSVANAGDELAKLSTKTGVVVEDLSRLQYAASLSDLSNEDLAASLIKLNKVMGEARDGSKEATEALRRFGIDPKSGITTIEAMSQIADRVKNTGDATRIASGMNDVFGKSFASLIPLLKGGSDGIKQAGDELERMGGVMSTDLAKSAEEFNDNITRLNRSLNALKLEFVGPLIPVLKSLTDQLLAAKEAANGNVWEGLKNFFAIGGDEAADPARRIAELQASLETLKTTQKDLGAHPLRWFVSDDIAIVSSQINSITEKIALLKRLQASAQAPAAPAADSGPAGAGIKDNPDKPTKAKKDPYRDLLTPAAEAYAKTIERINAAQLSADKSTRDLNGAQEALFDLMRSPDWERMPEAWRAVAIEQASAASSAMELSGAEKALRDAMARMGDAGAAADKSTRDLNASQSVLFDLMRSPEWERMPEPWKQLAVAQNAANTAAIEAADRQQRLNELLDATPSAKLEESRRDMLLLADAFNAGEISAEKFSEAAQAALGAVPPAAKEATDAMSVFAEEAARNMQDIFADYLFDGFSKGLDGMLEEFGVMLQKMIAQAVAADLMKRLMGTANETNWVGLASSFAGMFSGGGSAPSAAADGQTWEAMYNASVSGARAMGGPVLAGETYRVGENGPELLTMGGNGFVTPNHKIGGGEVRVFMNITAQDAQSFTASSGQVAVAAQRAIARARRNM